VDDFEFCIFMSYLKTIFIC